jgi:UBX domain-containing protein 7
MKLLFKGPFVEARAEAKLRKRWLLVNVQSDAEFACHLLNRDVLKDELVEGLVRWFLACLRG